MEENLNQMPESPKNPAGTATMPLSPKYSERPEAMPGNRGISAGAESGPASPENPAGTETKQEIPESSAGREIKRKVQENPAGTDIKQRNPETYAGTEKGQEKPLTELNSGDTEEDRKRAAKRSAFIEEALSWVKSFVLMFLVALFLTQFIIINAVIPSGSMEDTIMTHDRLIGARFSYWFDDPERGDIVIFHYPVDEKKIYIKRIIGLPGETVRIENGRIYIDDAAEPLSEGYLKEEWDVLNDGFVFHVPEGSYLMLGDNRNWSEDARYWADNALDEGLAYSMSEAERFSYVRKEKILGKAIFTYFRKFRILVHGDWYTQ
ncbi:MAG: signal peptidase I [Eubacteriales bacterium]|nr:signal peptidase I [Eubacteriales bacterium]